MSEIVRKMIGKHKIEFDNVRYGLLKEAQETVNSLQAGREGYKVGLKMLEDPQSPEYLLAAVALIEIRGVKLTGKYITRGELE